MATAESIARTGAEVVFVDAEPGGRCMDPGDLARLLSEPVAQRLRAIIPVHLYGRQADIETIRGVLLVAEREDVHVIGDAAQAHGSPGVGGLTELSCYSFYPAKNLGALGDGGMVISSNSELIERIRRLRNHGRAEKHSVDSVGLNSRFDELQAAALRIKLPHLRAHNAQRRAVASAYRAGLSGLPGLVLPEDSPEHVYHLYVVAVDPVRRDAIHRHLKDSGIGVGLHYPIPVHHMPPYPSERALPVSEAQCAAVLSLPMFPGMEVDEVRRVCHSLKESLRGEEDDP
jgi:dTDP-4-amino-4,6-dideoxygalactose transaminase